MSSPEPRSNLHPVDPDTFRRGFRNVPTVVTVVTFAPDGDGPTGITIGSFVSLSLEPPLVCFNVMKSARIHDRSLRAERFNVHVLRDDQAHLSDRFAAPDLTREDQLDGVEWAPDRHGIPVLNNNLVRFECRLVEVHDAGDHSIIVGLVEGVVEGGGGRPIVYHQRAYHAIGTHVADRSDLLDE